MSETAIPLCVVCGCHPAARAEGTCSDPCHSMARAVYDAWYAFKGKTELPDYVPESPADDADDFVRTVKSLFEVGS